MITRTKGRIVEADAAAGLKLLQMGMGRQTPAGVELYPLEAAFLTEKKMIDVHEGEKKLSVSDLLAEEKMGAAKTKTKKKTKSSPSLALPISDQFILYRAFRGSGHVVRFSPSSPSHWRVLARGVGREQERATMLVTLTTPDWSASLEKLEQMLALSRMLRLELTLGFVKEGRAHLIKISKPPVDS